jgi:hypothetical protein
MKMERKNRTKNLRGTILSRKVGLANAKLPRKSRRRNLLAKLLELAIAFPTVDLRRRPIRLGGAAGLRTPLDSTKSPRTKRTTKTPTRLMVGKVMKKEPSNMYLLRSNA